MPQHSLGRLFLNTQDLNSPKIWMNGDRDVWPHQMAGSHEMEQTALPFPGQRITRRSSNHLLVQHCCQQTERNCIGGERDWRIRILKNSDPARRGGDVLSFTDCLGRKMDGRIRILKKRYLEVGNLMPWTDCFDCRIYDRKRILKKSDLPGRISTAGNPQLLRIIFAQAVA